MSYNYDLNTHNQTDPSIIVPLLIDLFSPTSVIDIGCGLGNFLFEFKINSNCDVLGVDGDLFSDAMRSEFLTENEYLRADLTKPLNINRKFDIALCLEVAEHLPIEFVETFIENITQLSETVIFSAAIPLQGGQYHINEQWQSYWCEIFKNKGFFPVDCVRPIIWNNENVSFWYKQNIIVYCTKNSLSKNNLISTKTLFLNLVHPQNYYGKTSYLINLLKGKLSLKYYLYLIYKYFKAKFTSE